MNNDSIIISHVRQADMAIQNNETHSLNVAKLAADFATEFHMGDWAYMLGLLHDKGKERKNFQSYIRLVSGLDSTSGWNSKIDKQHAFVGALIAHHLYAAPIKGMLAYPLLGHHSGLDDYINYERKLTKELPSEVSALSEKINLSIPKEVKSKIPDIESLKRDMHHIIRMLYSCLVDADFLDTEEFMNPSNHKLRKKETSWEILTKKFNDYLSQLSLDSTNSSINRLRQKIQERCRTVAYELPGIYSLTVPTGGGKTLSSLAWALNHAIHYNKKRIIIAIPYTSIITQTAELLSSIFGKENVLEHHSNFDPFSIKDDQLRRRMRLASENWDYPIVVTTNVQLFESIMNNRNSDCRKIHNISNSILIMDEIQTLPLDHLQPIIDSLDTYNRLFGISILFTTASLPALDGTICIGSTNRKLRGLDRVKEIIPQEWNLHKKFSRTKLEIDKSIISKETLAEKLSNHSKVLCIVNSRRDAKEIYKLLPDDGIKIHLSRMMCPAHLKQSISLLKNCLKDDKEKVIRVIATQLIEAGVDIDFPVVYRQEAGLDSILQAAGRCNREGKNEISTVHIFRLNKISNEGIKKARDAFLNMPEDSDWFSPQAMKEYFIYRYNRHENFDHARIQSRLYKQEADWDFESASKDFRMINDNGSYPVIVNYKNSQELVDVLKEDGPSYNLIKQISQYTVNVYKQDFELLNQYGFIEEIIEGFFFLKDKSQYQKDVGLVTENHWFEEILML